MTGSLGGVASDAGTGPRKARHWFLTGFSGSGKTTVGALLAALVGRPFVDLDSVVGDELGRPVGEALSAMGEVRFRRAEASALAWVSRGEVPAVVALGAGALEATGAVDAARNVGLVVWLDAPLETCLGRTGQPGEPERPILARHCAAGAAALEDFHSARCAVYGAADLRVEASGAPDGVADEVLRRLVEAGEPLS